MDLGHDQAARATPTALGLGRFLAWPLQILKVGVWVAALAGFLAGSAVVLFLIPGYIHGQLTLGLFSLAARSAGCVFTKVLEHLAAVVIAVSTAWVLLRLRSCEAATATALRTVGVCLVLVLALLRPILGAYLATLRMCTAGFGQAGREYTVVYAVFRIFATRGPLGTRSREHVAAALRCTRPTVAGPALQWALARTREPPLALGSASGYNAADDFNGPDPTSLAELAVTVRDFARDETLYAFTWLSRIAKSAQTAYALATQDSDASRPLLNPLFDAAFEVFAECNWLLNPSERARERENAEMMSAIDHIGSVWPYDDDAGPGPAVYHSVSDLCVVDETDSGALFVQDEVFNWEHYSTNSCAICLSDGSLETWDLWSCGHAFCSGCSQQLLDRHMNCPICRAQCVSVRRGRTFVHVEKL